MFQAFDERTRESQEPRVRRLFQHEGFPEFPRNVILLSRDGSERRIENVYSSLHDRLSRRIGLVVAFRDVTERQKLEQEILKADKLESIGLLAGGIGLGLATTYSILRRHEGHIEVESEPGRGTTFSLVLPASASAPQETRQRTEEPISGRGKVLVMEDSDTLRVATAKMLTRLGYEVETARDGDTAIQLYRDAMSLARSFDAVNMDLTITGGMGGKDTIQQLLRIDPGVRAIAASGYSTDPIMAQFRDCGFSGRMSKPFGRHELAEVLQRVIGSKPKGDETVAT